MIDKYIILKAIWAIIKLGSIFYFVGLLLNLIISKKIQHGYLALYYYLLSGMLLSVSIHAIVHTKGLTVLLLIPLLLIPTCRAANKYIFKQQHYSIGEKAGPFLFIFCSIGVYFLYYLKGFSVDGNIIHYYYGDQEFYARIASNLNANGIENLRVEYLYPKRFSVEPYHFGDLWTIGLGLKITGINPIFLSVLVVAPLLISIFVLGFFALVIDFIPKSKIWLLSIMIIFTGFVGGFSLFFPAFIFPSHVDVYHHALCNYTKLFWWASILPIVLIFIYYKLDKFIIFPLLIIALGYINVLPSIVMSAVLWIAFIIYRRREKWTYLLPAIITSIIVVVFFYFFYSFYPSTQPQISKLSAKANVSLINILENYKTTFNIILGGGLQFLVYTPAFCLWIYMYIRLRAGILKLPFFNVMAYLLLLALSSLFVWAVFFSVTFESIQFFYNVFVVVMGLLSGIIYVYCFSYFKSTGIKILVLSLWVLAIFPNRKYSINITSISKQEWTLIKNFIAPVKERKFAHYRNLKDYSRDVFGSSTLVAMPLGVLSYCTANYQNYSLNVPFTILDSTKREYVFQKNNIAGAPMTYFVQLPENKRLDPDELMLKFIKTNRITFLCLPTMVKMPQSLQNLVKDSVFAPKIGWRIYRCD